MHATHDTYVIITDFEHAYSTRQLQTVTSFFTWCAALFHCFLSHRSSPQHPILKHPHIFKYHFLL
jgi:hypothetical protein